MNRNDPAPNGRPSSNHSPSKYPLVALGAGITVLCVLVLVVAMHFGGGVFFERKAPDPGNSSITTDSNATTGSTISDAGSSPTVSSTPTPIPPSPTPNAAQIEAFTADLREVEFALLYQEITEFLDAQTGRYSLYYINLSNGETIACKETEKMVAASTIKLPVNTYLYQLVAAGEVSLDEIRTYDARKYPTGDRHGGYGIIQDAANGTEYTLEELSRLSIRTSDNTATRMILRRIGDYDVVYDHFMEPISSVVDYCAYVTYRDKNGISKTANHRTSAIDMALYMVELYRLYSESPADYEGLIHDLRNTDYAWGISQGLPEGTNIAHKIGVIKAMGVNNDVAIVFGQEDFVLCVMSETFDEAKARANIGEVSRMVYDYIQCFAPTASAD